MNIKHISVSRSQVYKQCALQYKYKYHLKVPSQIPEPPYFLYGKVVHKIFEAYTTNAGSKEMADICKEVLSGELLLEEGRENDIPQKLLPREYLRKLPKHLVSFMRLTDKIGLEGTCEWEFKLDLDPPHEKFVYGFIDRLIERNGQFFLLDYKTTKKGPWRRDKHDVVTDLQLQCYARVVSKHFDVPSKDVKAALYYLEGEELLGASFSEKTLQGTAGYLLKMYNEIADTDPDKVRGYVGKHCERCPYRPICPFYSLT